MRLFKQREIYYVELSRGVRRSLRTKNEREAKSLFRDIKRESLLGNIIKFEKENNKTLSELLPLYINHPDRKNLSHKTHLSDRSAFRSFIKSVGDLPLNRINIEQINKFKTVLSNQDFSIPSINSYLRHIKSALNFAVENEYLKDPPKIKMLKVKIAPVRIISPDDITKILEYSIKHQPEMNRIITFVLFTGCRRDEVVKARYEHIQDDIVTVYGKGNKIRKVPLLPQAKSVLKNQAIGKIFNFAHSTISAYFKIIANTCGIDARFHDLRHTAATQMLKNGIKLEVIQKILGHADISTTQIYAKVLEESIIEEMKKLSY